MVYKEVSNVNNARQYSTLKLHMSIFLRGNDFLQADVAIKLNAFPLRLLFFLSPLSQGGVRYRQLARLLTCCFLRNFGRPQLMALLIEVGLFSGEFYIAIK